MYSNPIFSQGLYLTLTLNLLGARSGNDDYEAGSRDGDGEGTGPVSSPVDTIGK